MGEQVRRALVGVAVLWAARTARAQPAAVVASAPEPDRSGLFVLGGIGLASGVHWPRVDVLYPLRLARAPRLRVGMVLTYYHAKASIPEYSIEAYGFGAYPTATYDWVLPLRSTAGTFVIGVDGSLGPAIGRVKIDEPFMPGTFETVWVMALRTAGRAEFRANQGWIAAIQFLGFAVPLTHPDQPSKGTVTTNDISVELALLGGYQFQ